LRRLKPGTVLLRDYQGELTVTVVPTGYLWRETAYEASSGSAPLTPDIASDEERAIGWQRSAHGPQK